MSSHWLLVEVAGTYGLLRDGLFFYPVGDMVDLVALRRALTAGGAIRQVCPTQVLPDRLISTSEAVRIARERRPDRYAAASTARVADTIRQAVRSGHIQADKSPTGRHQIQLSTLVAWLDDRSRYVPRPRRKKGAS